MYKNLFKSVFDIVFAFTLLFFLLPLMVVIGICVMVDGFSPFYLQDRVGRLGRPFKIIKFRTMESNAEEKLVSYLQNDKLLEKEWAKFHKLEDDPRVTSVGKFLRRTKLDELPQFINVLMGSMSIVGPRPITLHEFEKYFDNEEEILKYQSVKPGLTGFWQINSDRHKDFKNRIKLELTYIRKLTFIGDLCLIVKTIGKMF
jgi:exopolysaccharide production protein ExoY